MGREFELKFRTEASVLAEIQEKYGAFTPISMETTYYDTFDLKLAFHHWTLRRRMENHVSVCTFKRPHQDGGRGEWEVEAPNIMDGVMKLCQNGADWELMRIAASGLMETCGARFTRHAALIELEDCTVELALDRGCLMGGSREEPLCEVEVEFKDGSEEAAAAFAGQLAEAFGLTAEQRSKYSRALALAQK